ncbi:MAG TPA: hypothetical protein VN285_10025, partial [Candidatus Deferrimicrobium sp.]|nr:hypothetical protein [Candidatus Deferrimicrobium sp.]
SSIFWFDDDLSSKVMKYSGDSLAWYAGYTDNIFVSGLRTIQYMHTSPLAPGNLLYDHFGLAAYVENTPSDFAGAYGQNGWPSVQSTPTGIFAGKVPVVPKLTPRPGATVIYTFDSYSNNSDFEGQPCGLLYSTSAGYRVLLSFPLYFMTHTSVQSVISHAKTLFGESATIAVNGDVDGSGVVEFVDLIYLIDFLFRGGSAPIDMNTADVDASCVVNVGDVTYFVAYLFLGGAEPLPGCAAR